MNITEKDFNFPKVSILVAVRNEEENILDCLEALSKLEYPKIQLDIWLGNDASTDQTVAIIQDFISDKPLFHLQNIAQNKNGMKGKANVLAQLSRLAKGDYFLITDADIRVNPFWIEGMLTPIQNKENNNIGIVTGFTVVQGNSLFAKLQAIDWVSGLSLVKILSDWGIAVTTMGNNMLISKEAYFSVGGYENIPFSVTEDYALFEAVIKKKWDFKNLINSKVLAFSEPLKTFKDLLHQRKRWMNGAIQLPIFILILLGIQSLFFPVLAMLLFYNLKLALGIWAAKLISQAIVIAPYLQKINRPKLLYLLPVYEIYVNILMLLATVFYCSPIQLEWKGRKY